MSNYIYQVLVVEDEPIILRDTVQEINDAELGFHVKWTAYNGKDALELVEKEKPDVIFSDIKMPIMSGMEFIENIRMNYPKLPIVLLTGFSEFDYAKQAIQFQVEDYLLKPLEVEELKEVLRKIYAKLEGERKNNERNIVYSKIHGTSGSQQPMPFQYEKDLFELYLIQTGNRYYYDFPTNILEQIQAVWNEEYWTQWLEEVCGNRIYWLVDGKKPNQKFLIVDYRRKRSMDERMQFAVSLKEKVQKEFQGLPVHIVFPDSDICYQDIWTVSGVLRSIIDHSKVGSEILVQGQKIQHETSWIPVEMKKKVEVDLENGNLRGIKEEIKEILLYAEANKYSQNQIEEGILQIHEKIKGEDKEALSGSLLQQVRCELFFQEQIPKEKIWEILEKEYVALNIGENLEVSVKQIEAYIQKHYAEDISVAELSRRFHFNGNYLTRIFKKYTGEAPMNYLIQTRLNKSIDLMKTREDLDIREISRMVGYEDSHYFSRIFKNKLGKSPSEYRKDIKGNGKN